MSRKNKRYAYGSKGSAYVKPESGEGSIAFDEMMAAMAPDVEVITDELIAELVGLGLYEEKILIEAREGGLSYCRGRNSFFM